MADPLSILGAAVGVTSLLLQITDECIKGYKAYSDALNMPSEYRYLRVMFQIQQHRFFNFGLQAGILEKEGKLCPTLQINRGLLLAVLAEIKNLFEQYYMQEEKWRGEAPETIDLNQYYKETESGRIDFMSLLNPDERTRSEGAKHDHITPFRRIHNKASRTYRNLRTITTEPRRISWTTLGKEAFQTMTTRLEALNSFLTSLLDSSQIRRLEETTNAAYQEIIQLRNDVGSLQHFIKALTADKATQGTGHLAKDIQDGNNPMTGLVMQRTAAFEKMKSDSLFLAQVKIQYTKLGGVCASCFISADDVKSVEDSLSLQGNRQLDFARLAFFETFSYTQDNDSRRQLGTYEGQPVFVEWKVVRASNTYRRRYLASDADPTTGLAEQIEHRIQLLTDLLAFKKPAEFRVARCLGYVKDSDSNENGQFRFGIVFDRLTTAGSSSELATLRELLEKGAKPSLSSRMRLCAILARSVHSFHAVNWMHKGLRSHNVIFLVMTRNQPPLDLPFLSGFELSRPAGNASMTEKPMFNPSQDIYRHPLAQSAESGNRRYRKAYDIYSLGIMLVEIALWKGIERFIGFDDITNVRPHQLSKIKDCLLGNQTEPPVSVPVAPEGRSCMEWIGAECGDTFRGVVTQCLTADSLENEHFRGESDEEIAIRMQQVVSEDILAKLENIASCI